MNIIAPKPIVSSATRGLAKFAAGFRYEALSDHERRSVRRHVLDTLGACIAGSAQEVTRRLQSSPAVLVEEYGRIVGIITRHDVLDLKLSNTGPLS